MNIHKHMEAIFVGALAVAGLGSYLLDSLPEAQARPAAVPQERMIATGGQMAVVVVKAPRVDPGR